MNRTARTALTLTTALGLALPAALSGCSLPGRQDSVGSTHLVVTRGPRITERSLAGVHAFNPHGSIRVLVDPSRERPEITARRRGASDAGIGLDARTEIGLNRMNLVVEVTDAAEEGTPIDLVIWTPSCGEVLIEGSGGTVELVGVSGQINVQRGADGQPGGDVLIRTNDHIPGPVNIFTSDGDVRILAGTATAGQFELVADDGEVSFSASVGEIRQVRPSESRWTGVVNKGVHAFTVRTLRGDVEVRLAEGDRDQLQQFNWRGHRHP